MSTSEKEEFDLILKRYYDGKATVKEENFLEAYYAAYDLRSGLIDKQSTDRSNQLFSEISFRLTSILTSIKI